MDHRNQREIVRFESGIQHNDQTPSQERLAVEDEKIEEAVQYLNERTILSGLELAKAVGKYILNTFFDGSYAEFSNPSRSKSTSFRGLLAREDLLLGKSTIYNFVRISHQLEILPDDVIHLLTLAHHRALLPLQSPESKESLARRALEKGWSSRVLSGEVRKMLPKARSGRKPLSPLAKSIYRIENELEQMSEEIIVDGIRELGQERSSFLVRQIEKSLSRLKTLKNELECAMNDSGR